MRHTLKLPGRGDPDIVVESGLMRIPSVFVDGREVDRVTERGRAFWPIPLPEGGEKRLYIRNSLTGLRGAVDGTVIPLERQLRIWEVVLALLPFGLVGLGLPGGALGLVASAVNLRLMRRPWSTMGRILAVLAVLAIATGLTLLVLGLTSGG